MTMPLDLTDLVLLPFIRTIILSWIHYHPYKRAIRLLDFPHQINTTSAPTSQLFPQDPFSNLLFTKMTFSIADMPDQTGKVAIVTGGTAGLGLQSVIALARKDCHVIFTARSTSRGQEALKKIKTALSPALFKVEFGVADNEDLDSIVAFANSFLSRNLPLHILLLNAGVGTQPFRVIHGAESTLFINHQSAPSRVVIVSSIAHTFYDSLCDVESGQYLDGSWSPATNQFTQCVCQLGAITRSGVHLTHLPWYSRFFVEAQILYRLHWAGLKPEIGALTQLYVATSPHVEKNRWQGQYFTPIAKLDQATSSSRDLVQVDRLWKWTSDVIARVLDNK
ncbi:hypothetical protein AC1031_005777 [Aphanomyces cochlioides]|nr:hypothetical protein AC1031_005777 [Aphanomyces cochlioides]